MLIVVFMFVTNGHMKKERGWKGHHYFFIDGRDAISWSKSLNFWEDGVRVGVVDVGVVAIVDGVDVGVVAIVDGVDVGVGLGYDGERGCGWRGLMAGLLII